ncbi:hypothetical protein IEQ34_019350 [Dendrobium chrysotoxum]|uniref:Uncharacterized protein n=1 Tax=Dendrobium chrysotoxum TaxID=161865 RepID=A0AAV7G6U4_DENCH|nr:hypothetical protein IEQ34_019350 [Dendrobium chrysotoxum]
MEPHERKKAITNKRQQQRVRRGNWVRKKRTLDDPEENDAINTDALTQMMIAITQLIQDSRSQPLGKIENWLLRIEKILDGMFCPEERNVSLAIFALDG